jgi:hypothetical protein
VEKVTLTQLIFILAFELGKQLLATMFLGKNKS